MKKKWMSSLLLFGPCHLLSRQFGWQPALCVSGLWPRRRASPGSTPAAIYVTGNGPKTYRNANRCKTLLFGDESTYTRWNDPSARR